MQFPFPIAAVRPIWRFFSLQRGGISPEVTFVLRRSPQPEAYEVDYLIIPELGVARYS
jgi:hypothetical protein